MGKGIIIGNANLLGTNKNIGKSGIIASNEVKVDERSTRKGGIHTYHVPIKAY